MNKTTTTILVLALLVFVAGCTTRVMPPSTEDCTCPTGYTQDGNFCNPECLNSNPPCAAPSFECGSQPNTAATLDNVVVDTANQEILDENSDVDIGDVV